MFKLRTFAFLTLHPLVLTVASTVGLGNASGNALGNMLGPALGNIWLDDWDMGRNAVGPSCNVASSGSGAVNARGSVFESRGHGMMDHTVLDTVTSILGSGGDMVNLRHPAFKPGGVPVASEGGIGSECGGIAGGIAARYRVGEGNPR